MELEIKGQNYRFGVLDAFKQFHLARRIAPVMGSLAQAGGLKDALQPIAEAVARMPDQDCNFVLQTCLRSVQRQSGPVWANIFVGESLMFDLGVMLQLTAKVIQENLGPFFLASVATLTPAATPAE
jgi:hypothetical protein